jgi:hypothetical protein
VTVQETPLGLKMPDSATELVKRGAEVITANAQRTDELIAALQGRLPANYDGGTPNSVYATEQFMDGGGV